MTYFCYELLQLVTKNILSHLENISGILFGPKLKLEFSALKKISRKLFKWKHGMVQLMCIYKQGDECMCYRRLVQCSVVLHDGGIYQ